MRFFPAQSVATVVGTVALMAPAIAAAEPELRLATFEAPTTCPSRTTFESEVRRRTRTIARDDDEALSFGVQVVTVAPDLLRGKVVVDRAASGTSERVVEGATCQEVMHALALVVALSIDPDGGGREREGSEPAGAAGSAEAMTPGPALARSMREQPAAGTEARARPEPSFVFALGAHAAAQGGVGADTTFTVPVFVEVGARRPPAPAARVRFAPSARLTFVRGSGERSIGLVGAASFTWTSGEIDLCPVAVDLAPLSLSSCARLELGALTGQGVRIEPARGQTRTWAALAVPVRLRAALTSWLFVEVEGGPRFPLPRERFVFQPDITVFRAPAVAAWAGGGAGITFP